MAGEINSGGCFNGSKFIRTTSFPFSPPQIQWSFSLANCYNISGCQILGYIKKHELYCCLHLAYGKQGMSMWTAMCFILSALWQGSANVGLLEENLSKTLRIFGSKGITQGLFWKCVYNFWCLPEEKKKHLMTCYSKNWKEMLMGFSSNYLGNAC